MNSTKRILRNSINYYCRSLTFFCKKLHLRCLVGFRIRLCILLPLGWSSSWLEVLLMTVIESNWRTDEQTTDYIYVINVRCLFRAFYLCINMAFFFMVFLFFWISKYEVYSFKIQWKFSAFKHLMLSKQSKFNAGKTYRDFRVFDFALYPQSETRKSQKMFFYFKFSDLL